MARRKGVAPKSVYRRQLADRLRDLREDTHLTLTEVTDQVEVGASTLSRIETGDRGTSPLLVKALLDCYGVTDATTREDVLDLVRADQAHERPWWRKYAAAINTTQYGGFLSLESSATYFRSYEPLLVPGLLQTEEYAREVIAEVRKELAPREVEALVKVRMQRQQLLEGDDPLKLWIIIDEASLRRRVGSQQLMRQQIQHLRMACDHPSVTLQMLPFDAGAHQGLLGSFVIMDFPDPTPEVVWVEHIFGNSVCFDDRKNVDSYAEAFDHLRALAAGPPETRRRLDSLTKELAP
ncbi:helix-turn-helix domain-containing protein [Streptomyces boncukensis]|uniref:Helix-turn-helix domain-containing protein n=1 Tax=Streptomyces boncukensis TaxID=2711219 RepID=A0A6G4X8K4_9ACTN|nr:helix-turn-helix transcriptional regulator [Streptomyces boncukensis]NGO73879.1 helix-turn-helix domain-containing protein [Streptomyces boncukensis]